MTTTRTSTLHETVPEDLRAIIAEERERRRIGGLLHDGLGQTLVLLRRRLADLAPACDRATAAAIESCVRLTDEALAETRSLTFELSPPVVDELGLLPGLRWLADDLRRRYGRPVEIVDDGHEPALAPGPRGVVFRVLRELLLNALRHTAAEVEIVLSVRSSAAHLRAIVRDTGAGFDVTRLERPAAAHEGFGLRFARRQVEGLGGRLEIHSERDAGTRAALDLPLHEDAP